MRFKIQISEDALQDLNDGFRFYEAQGAGLGDYFAASLKADIENLKTSADVHRVVFEDYQRVLSRVFPYGIFYTLESDNVTIWAILDLRRDPEWIRRQLAE